MRKPTSKWMEFENLPEEMADYLGTSRCPNCDMGDDWYKWELINGEDFYDRFWVVSDTNGGDRNYFVRAEAFIYNSFQNTNPGLLSIIVSLTSHTRVTSHGDIEETSNQLIEQVKRNFPPKVRRGHEIPNT